MNRFEDAYTADLINEVVNEIGSAFKRPPSMLILGGGQWRFGKQVGGHAKIERIMYAENRTADLQSADQNQMLTVACEIHDAAKVCTGSKYDIILMKNTLEMIAPHITVPLDEYIVALYKTLKLNGIAILVSRLRPTLPLPQKQLDEWNKNVPDESGIKDAVEKADLGIELRVKKIEKKGTASKKDWIDSVKMLPYAEGLSDADITSACAKQTSGDKVSFTDTVYVITLAKNIKRVQRGEDGMIISNGVDT